MEGNLLLKIDWASLIVGSAFTVIALFYFVFEGNFQVQAPPGGGAYIWRGDLRDGFLRYEFGGLIFGGLIHGGAYFRNFTVYRQYRLTLVWKYNVLNRYLTCLKGHGQELFLQFNPFPGNLTNIINYFEFEITKQKKKDMTVTPY